MCHVPGESELYRPNCGMTENLMPAPHPSNDLHG